MISCSLKCFSRKLLGKLYPMQLIKRERQPGWKKQLAAEIRVPENNINANDVTVLEEKKTELEAIRKHDT